MKKLAIVLAVAGALVAGQAYADVVPSFSLGGYTGAVKIKFSNWESFSTAVGSPPAVGDTNWGILKITSIESDDGNNTALWVSGQGGAEITGVFRGITVATVTAQGPGFNIKSSGGLMDLWINNVGDFAAAGGANQGSAGYTDAGCGIGGSCYDGISNQGGGMFLSLAWAAGVDPGSALITIDGNLDGGTLPGTGDATGFMDVGGGLYASMFDSNGQVTPWGNRDINVQNDFCANGSPGCAVPEQGDWQLVSEDPARANVVPEPASLALVGLGLFGLVALRRKIVR